MQEDQSNESTSEAEKVRKIWNTNLLWKRSKSLDQHIQVCIKFTFDVPHVGLSTLCSVNLLNNG